MPSETSVDVLADVSEKTTKSDLLERVNQLADLVRRTESKRLGRLAEIEKRVREKHRPGDMPELHNAIVTATAEEWKATVAFLGEFEDLLPAPLARIYQGGKLLLEPKDETET